MKDELIHVYFMPGMAANPSIFEHIELSEEMFKTHYLKWIIPKKEESLQAYAKRMTEKIVHKNPVLVGVSFGGIMVQEMAKIISVRKLIIISSVKSNKELPKRMIFAKYTKAHKLLPTQIVNNIELLTKYAFGEKAVKRVHLYEKYLSVRNKYYLDWAIDNIINWEQEVPVANTIHIHGEKDRVFSLSHIKDCIVVKGGTHVMIINKFKWFNENLPSLITEKS
ncbi:alpha/beta hydrolase [Galbibacter sp. EGI 63066]|uniref:alpha/beta hydrolase n=1 Tax=Galbibacter sp. EGI 63066 TaxID=2993559 RepID=UPI002248F890|nr:alpha/beta hydrolase [Galbibacter sp. EGI 63066]MCX2678511.1 alpha/beta hydrolase [Galbibacter sp. EGI 63066]